MVEVTVNNNDVEINFEGISELWSFKHNLLIPIENIQSVHAIDELKTSDYLKWDTFKVGEYLPNSVAKGTFYQNNEKLFIDINEGKSGIVLKLKNNKYYEIIIELKDYKEIAQKINDVLK